MKDILFTLRPFSPLLYTHTYKRNTNNIDMATQSWNQTNAVKHYPVSLNKQGWMTSHTLNAYIIYRIYN